MQRKLKTLAIVAAGALALGTAGCSATSPEDSGTVTLNFVSIEAPGSGPQKAIEALTASFEKANPGVKVKIDYRDLTSWQKAEAVALASSSAPDIVQGNQGYGTDARLVAGKLIEPLDDYAEEYGWTTSFQPGILQQYLFTPDGKSWGTGNLYGISYTGQSMGVYANLSKLADAGIDVASLDSFDAFTDALATLRSSLPTSEPVIQFANKVQYEAFHVWGEIQSVFTPSADVQSWVYHSSDDATIDNAGNLKALETLVDWKDDGYLGTSDEYKSKGETEAAEAFAGGKGAFLIAGNWMSASVAPMGDNVAFFNMPRGADPKYSGIGSTSTVIHIASKSEHKDLAAKYIDWIVGPQASAEYLAQGQVPAVPVDEADIDDPLTQQLVFSWNQLVADEGLNLFPDLASPTMFTTLGANFDDVLAGRTAPREALKNAQADWLEYHETLK